MNETMNIGGYIIKEMNYSTNISVTTKVSIPKNTLNGTHGSSKAVAETIRRALAITVASGRSQLTVALQSGHVGYVAGLESVEKVYIHLSKQCRWNSCRQRGMRKISLHEKP